MDIVSINFVILFLFCVVIYYCVNAKYRNLIMLLISFGFYGLFSLKMLAGLIGVGVFIYIMGLLIAGKEHRTRKYCIIGAWCVLLGILIFFKYSDYFLDLLQFIEKGNILVPVGISFFILQAISYLMDVYRKDIAAEKNIINVLLYLSFFPCILSGPIQKGKEFIPEIRKSKALVWDNVEKGLLMCCWGYFQKLVLSNRLAVMVDNIFAQYTEQKGIILIIGAAVYGLQLYVDFSGYSDIVIGIAKVFGFDLLKNFDFPYSSLTIKEFWRRWHISLSSWLKEYIYFPLGGSRKGTFRKYLNVMIVFLVSGLWHGNGLNYLVWGALHGVYQVIGDMTQKGKKKIHDMAGIDENSLFYKFYQKLIVFLLVDFAWIFFKAADVQTAIRYIRNMFYCNFGSLFDGTLLNFGLGYYDYIILILGVVIFWVGSYIRKHYDIYKTLQEQFFILFLLL